MRVCGFVALFWRAFTIFKTYIYYFSMEFLDYIFPLFCFQLLGCDNEMFDLILVIRQNFVFHIHASSLCGPFYHSPKNMHVKLTGDHKVALCCVSEWCVSVLLYTDDLSSRTCKGCWDRPLLFHWLLGGLRWYSVSTIPAAHAPICTTIFIRI